MQRYVCRYNKSAQRLRHATAVEVYNHLDPHEAKQLEAAMQRLGKELGLGPNATFELLTCLGIYLAENEIPRDGKRKPRLPRRRLSYEFFSG